MDDWLQKRITAGCLEVFHGQGYEFEADPVVGDDLLIARVAPELGPKVEQGFDLDVLEDPALPADEWALIADPGVRDPQLKNLFDLWDFESAVTVDPFRSADAVMVIDGKTLWAVDFKVQADHRGIVGGGCGPYAMDFDSVPFRYELMMGFSVSRNLRAHALAGDDAEMFEYLPAPRDGAWRGYVRGF